MRVWTMQHRNVYGEVARTSSYYPDGSYIGSDMPEYRDIVLESYTWLRDNMPCRTAHRGTYPIWVTLTEGNNYPVSDDGVLLELEVPDELVCRISIERWSAVLDRRYIARDSADALRHRGFMEKCGLSDAGVCMSPFYPDLKKEIQDSWKAVFDTDGLPDSMCYGLIPGIRSEWIVSCVM